jgi:oxaloacetate decarboxylase alpha subunit/pyruvate carboxylase subunit B
MLSNFRNQLKEQNMSDRFDAVLEEIPRVREALGWIPLVTPTSQIVGTQAMMNVKFGRWKMLSQPAADVALGKYGRTPAPVDPEVLKIAMANTKQEPVTCRPADLLEPRMDKLRAEIAEKGLPVNDETAVLYAMFPHEVVKLYTQPAPAPAPAATEAPAQRMEMSEGHYRYVFTANGIRREAFVEEIS